ncbi:hypothetical protein [Larkinella arboricola]|nr:hypothetical protein [Larkinella arboricola]
MIILSVLLVFIIPSFTLIQLRNRALKHLARTQAVTDFRKWVMELDSERFYRTGEPGLPYLERLPPYETMLMEELPLKLDAYFHDSEIRKLLGVPKKSESL